MGKSDSNAAVVAPPAKTEHASDTEQWYWLGLFTGSPQEFFICGGKDFSRVTEPLGKDKRTKETIRHTRDGRVQKVRPSQIALIVRKAYEHVIRTSQVTDESTGEVMPPVRTLLTSELRGFEAQADDVPMAEWMWMIPWPDGKDKIPGQEPSRSQSIASMYPKGTA